MHGQQNIKLYLCSCYMTNSHRDNLNFLFSYFSAIFPFQFETMSDEKPLFRFRRQTYHKNRGILSMLADYVKQVNTKDTNFKTTLQQPDIYGATLRCLVRSSCWSV